MSQKLPLNNLSGSKILLNLMNEKAKFCYMDRKDFIVYIKTDDLYQDFAEDHETKLDNPRYELDRPVPKEKI